MWSSLPDLINNLLNQLELLLKRYWLLIRIEDSRTVSEFYNEYILSNTSLESRSKDILEEWLEFG